MSFYLKTAKMVFLSVGFLGLVACVSDLPVKTVRDESPSPSAEVDKINDRPAAEQTAENPKVNAGADQQPGKAETIRLEDIKLGNLELQKYAYELGFDPKQELTPEQKQQIVNRKRVRELERTLDSQSERLQYSKVLPWLSGDQEKIDLLSIPSVEGRQVWINKNKIWSRAKNLKDFDDVLDSQDIAIGMPADYVKKSWGEPDDVEVSGNPIYRNERWQYSRQVATPQGYRQERRYVYFEGGRVVGWETE